MKKLCLITILFSSILFVSCSKESKDSQAVKATTETAVEINSAMLAAFAPLPKEYISETNPLTLEKIDLGRMLYYDKRLSKNHDISCNTCHNLEMYGVDNKPTSPGHKGQLGVRNSPTVYNAAGHFAQFWDGREPDVEAQAKGPILNPIEMGMPDAEYVITVLKSIPGYAQYFEKAFPGETDPITYDNVGLTIGAFERKLVTPSKWDDYLNGNKMALSNAEKEGFNAFVKAGCIACHTGALLGGTMYQKLGLVKPWPNNIDEGRISVTNAATDKFLFKVSGLRDITKTGPYLHDGSIVDLETLVAMMAEYQMGQMISESETKAIVSFLDALTGIIPADYIAEPELPASGPNTPKPDPS
ncbi:MAG: cytochrome-c peroxidase [Candidatus Marinimicrobia bacterium]|nr:cytochrome-c peroxidase [Candidatus Neomarinimicrobiota bacterium]